MIEASDVEAELIHDHYIYINHIIYIECPIFIYFGHYIFF